MTGDSGRAPVRVLLVEDNPGDVRLVREALGEGRVPSTLSVARDGVEAMAFLRREGAHGAAPRPHVVLLDLNLPRMDGREVLADIKGDPALRGIPVVVLSSSAAERDVAEAYALHANCFVTKPVDLDAFLAVIRSIEAFWFDVAQLPAGPA